MPYENIVVKTRGRGGLITRQRPKQLNALNDALMDKLNRRWQSSTAATRSRPS
jgi:enoyl-CoA hydratase